MGKIGHWSWTSIAVPSLRFCVLLAAALFITEAPVQAASYRDDIGYTRLQDELGTSIPDGTGVTVTQVEAEAAVTVNGQVVYTWMLDDTHTDFSGKTVVFKSPLVAVPSGHATTVGRNFFGNSSSMAPGIVAIDTYEANHWLGGGCLAYGLTSGGNPVQPHYAWPARLASPARIANHSWVGIAGTIDADLLRRLDFVVETDEYIQIAAVNNSGIQNSLLSGAFNAVTVGLTSGGHPTDTTAVDSIYIDGRTCPLVVAPLSKTSFANPIVASVAALLVETGRHASLSTDPFLQNTTNRDGDVIRNAERSEVVKAALLCGADRVTHNTWSADQIIDYRQDGANGLDRRFGAGQVNVYHSYRIVAAGEQNSREDHPAGGGGIGSYGFDVDPFFGGDGGSNSAASYYFTAGPDRNMLYASLVWHLHIDGGVFYDYDPSATGTDFDLVLQDVTDPAYPDDVAVSSSVANNTENLWVPLTPGREYRLQVKLGTGQSDCMRDYALAWRITLPPDSDGDSLPDDWEVLAELNHLDADSDGDGMDDGFEHDHALNPLDPADASEDPDGDGFTNLEEYRAGPTNPQDPTDFPAPVSVPAIGVSGLLVALVSLLMLGQWASTSFTQNRQEDPDEPTPHVFHFHRHAAVDAFYGQRHGRDPFRRVCRSALLRQRPGHHRRRLRGLPGPGPQADSGE